MSDGIIQIDIDSSPIRRILDQLIAKGSDMSDPFRAIAGIMEHAVEKNFAQQGRPSWLPLAASTVSARERKHPGAGIRILQDAGNLAGSISARSDAFHASVGAGGGAKEYAAIHQFGGDAGRNHASHIPARPYLTLGDDDTEEIIDILEQYFVKP